MEKDVNPDFPLSLAGKFGVVVLDESHTLRNKDSNQAIGVAWLMSDFHVLLTATPQYNSAEDCKGLLPLLIPEKNDKLWPRLNADLKTDPYNLGDDNKLALLQLTRFAMETFIWNDQELTGGAVGHHIAKIWRHCTLYDPSLPIIPHPIQQWTGHRRLSPLPRHIDVSANLPSTNASLTKSGQNSCRKGFLLSGTMGRLSGTWQNIVSFYLSQHGSGSVTFRAKSKRARCARLLKLSRRKELQKRWIMTAMKAENDRQRTLARNKVISENNAREGLFDIPLKDSDISDMKALVYLLRGAPKMKAMLRNLRDQILVHQEKAIIWCSTPGNHQYVAAVLALAGLDYRVFHAELDGAERQDIIEEFTTQPVDAMILVCSYYVNSAGSNLQGMCRNVHLFDVPTSEAMLNQAVGGSRRLGQLKIVKVYEYIVEDSFNIKQLNNSMNKVIPTLVAELNSDFINLKFDKDKKEIDLGLWRRNEDQTLSRLSAKEAVNVPTEDLVQGDDVIYALLHAMKSGAGGIFRTAEDDLHAKKQSNLSAFEAKYPICLRARRSSVSLGSSSPPLSFGANRTRLSSFDTLDVDHNGSVEVKWLEEYRGMLLEHPS